MTRQLHDIYRTARSSEPDGAWLKTLIARSLGEPDFFHLVYSRHGLCSLARQLNIPAPRTIPVTAGTLAASLDFVGLPAVLKSDGSWSGKGVAIVTNRREAKRAFRKLSTPPSVLLTLKRFTLNRDRHTGHPVSTTRTVGSKWAALCSRTAGQCCRCLLAREGARFGACRSPRINRCNGSGNGGPRHLTPRDFTRRRTHGTAP